MMKLLVAIEDLEFGQKIAQFVLENFQDRNLQIRVVRAVEPMHEGFYFDPVLQEKIMQEAARIVSVIAQHLREGLPKSSVKEEVCSGIAKEVLLSMAQEWGCDFILMGSHGRVGLTKFLLGSVSSAVVSHAPCSVIVVKDKQRTMEQSPAVGAASNGQRA